MQIGKIFAGRIFARSRQGLTLPLLALLAAFAAPLPALAQQAQAPKVEAPKTDAPKTGAPKVAPAEDASIKTTDVVAHTVIETHGAASWEEGYAKINDSLAKLRASATKAGLKTQGHPMAVFTETDDAGFKFDAMLPVDAAADAKPDLGADISLGQSPSGKAIKFQHRGAYDDIDSTYEAITAYLDEKGLEARNLFVEQYLNDAKDSGDMALQVDIYVFLK